MNYYRRITLPSLGGGASYIYVDDLNRYHREGGPAIECWNGDRFWFKHGKLHRLDGPASEFADGNKEWFYQEEKIPCSSQEEYEKYLKLKLLW